MAEAIRPCVLVFAGLDPSGGAGIQADLEAIAAQGAHALPIVTALTVQDNNRVREVVPVDACLLTRQAALLAESMPIRAIKVGIPGSLANAEAIAGIVRMLRVRRPALPLVLDPVLASGHGDPLARGDALAALAPLLALATVLTPNLAEAAAIGPVAHSHVLITGGHGTGDEVINRWISTDGMQDAAREWRWPRLPGEFHGSGCTLASSLAARLALGEPMAQALENAQRYCNQALTDSYPIAPGQRIPRRLQH
jgi:hydroxymethylpyrimidine/phosphomethylpyrimidine kinase